MKTDTTYKCKKDLHKSTYNGNAFTKGRTYRACNHEDPAFVWLTDNQGNEFSMSKEQEPPYYFVCDYFEEPITNKLFTWLPYYNKKRRNEYLQLRPMRYDVAFGFTNKTTVSYGWLFWHRKREAP